jgi:hypothetical protein
MERDGVVDLMTRFVLGPGESVTRLFDEPDSVELVTNVRRYRARPATWAIARAEGVEEAVRVYAVGELPNSDLTFGFLRLTGGRVCFLNSVADMADLGRALPGGPGVIDPLAYAEVLSELYTHPDISGPVVYPFSAPFAQQSGFLVRDPAAFLDAHPGVDAPAVAAPAVSRVGDAVDLRFSAYSYVLLEYGVGVSVFSWWVRATAAAPATWERTTVVDLLPLPSRRP